MQNQTFVYVVLQNENVAGVFDAEVKAQEYAELLKFAAQEEWRELWGDTPWRDKPINPKPVVVRRFELNPEFRVAL